MTTLNRALVIQTGLKLKRIASDEALDFGCGSVYKVAQDYGDGVEDALYEVTDSTGYRKLFTHALKAAERVQLIITRA